VVEWLFESFEAAVAFDALTARGLAFGLHKLAFDERNGRLALAEADPALGDPPQWHLHEFVPHPGYRAALAWKPV
jgi:4'-phosphopantetheinyl transferase